MKLMKKFLGIAAVIAVIGFMVLPLAGCPEDGGGSGGGGAVVPSGLSMADAIPLAENVWADGNISTLNGQWFKFTATAATQYIHFKPGTLTSVDIQLYNDDGVTTVGTSSTLSAYASRTITNNSVYYIKVTPSNDTESGTYKITFNKSSTILPTENITTLTADTWADGNISTADGEQWFKFTATEISHYIHVSFGTLTNLYVQVYGSNGTEVETWTYLYSSTTNTNRTTAVDQEYYIKVTPYSGYSGTYKIAFNTSTTPPAITLPTENLIPLTADTWADGSISTAGGEQWFKFTATANPNHIHFSPGTLTSVKVNVYNSSGNIVGNQINLTSSTKISSRATTASQEYYIKITPDYGSGAYKIAFSASFIPLGKTATQLTADTWVDGSITSSSNEQWFKFTATASTQYIHVSFGTLPGLYVQVYGSNGTEVGTKVDIYNNSFNKYTNRTTTADQEYYIKITPYDSSVSGTYQIAFSASTTPPSSSP
jgi:hypothetical protein